MNKEVKYLLVPVFIFGTSWALTWAALSFVIIEERMKHQASIDLTMVMTLYGYPNITIIFGILASLFHYFGDKN